PALSVMLSFQRSVLVTNRTTRPITVGTVIEVSFISLSMWLFIEKFMLVGAVAAALALVTGRLACNSYLLFPIFKRLNFVSERVKNSND
ncbi:MAG: hypothetical protein GXO77_09445, partial [Calditrichaeota bacterium]|nr:hypothetical protein [Calditrichota bacterium]